MARTIIDKSMEVDLEDADDYKMVVVVVDDIFFVQQSRRTIQSQIEMTRSKMARTIIRP